MFGAIFNCFNVYPVDGLMCKKPCLLYAHVISAMSFNDAGTIIHLSFMVIFLSMIVISFLNDQYVLTEYLDVHCQGCPFLFISLAVLQSGMSIYDYCIDGDTHTWYFFISILWLCLYNQSAMNSCGPGMYCIPMLYL